MIANLKTLTAKGSIWRWDLRKLTGSFALQKSCKQVSLGFAEVNMVDYGLKDRVAIITGANNPQGIGAATALAFAREGANVVIAYQRIPRDFDEAKTGTNGVDRYFKANAGDASEVEAKLRELGARYLVLEKDISDEAQVKEVFDAAIERFGRVDVLINNAADGDMDGIDTIELITQSVIDDTFAVNVRGSLLMTREFVQRRGDYGRVVFLSTDSAQVFAGQITYGASKATLEALTRSVAMEVGQYGITVNSVAPGPTQTGWIDEELEEAVLPLIPMGKLIQPEDIANTIVFLASKQARMITGQVIKVSGGHAL
ncbi:MAG: SDR family oxidoreductase [Eggerthellaceae bacterium]|nr:SDR family oxidoreductase [Eggerthellaceae bacterium]